MIGNARFLSPASPEWTEILRSAAHDIYHLPGYVSMEASSLGGTAVAFAYSEGHKSMLLPLVLRPIAGSSWIDAVSPHGYPGPAGSVGADDPEFWSRACSCLLQELKGISALTCFVRLNPLLDVPYDALAQIGAVVAHGSTVAVDLTLTPAEMEAQTRKNHRRAIKKGRQEGLTVVIEADWSRIQTFADIYYETMERVGADEYYYFDRDYFQQLRTAVGSHVHLALVEHDGEAQAGGLFFEECGIVQYHLGATRSAALQLQPAKLMFDDVRLWAKERGNFALHLGGGVGGMPTSLFRFKAGFSNWQLPFCTWRIVTDESAYAALARKMKPAADPLDLEHYFPVYRDPAFGPVAAAGEPGTDDR